MAHSSQTRAILADLNKVVSKLSAKIALDIAGNLKEVTPRDTGWARANWVAEIGSPPNTDGGTSGRPSDAEVSARRAVQTSSERKLLSYDVHLGKIYVSNKVSYIQGLNSGSSRQAPAGFVQRSIAKAVTQDIQSFRP